MEPDCAPVRLPSIYVRLLSLRSEAIRGRRFTYIFSGRTSISRAFKIISDLYSASCSALKTDVSLQQFLFICGSEACLKLSLQLIKQVVVFHPELWSLSLTCSNTGGDNRQLDCIWGQTGSGHVFGREPLGLKRVQDEEVNPPPPWMKQMKKCVFKPFKYITYYHQHMTNNK